MDPKLIEDELIKIHKSTKKTRWKFLVYRRVSYRKHLRTGVPTSY